MNFGRRISLIVILIAVLVLGYNLFLHQRTAEPDPQLVRLIQDGKLTKSDANWVDTRLYFGLGPHADDAAWQDFLDHEVTPRFPSGLSVIDVYGQWQGGSQAPIEHIRTKLLVIDYPDTAANDARIEAIRAAWKKRTGDQSVLKVTQAASVSF